MRPAKRDSKPQAFKMLRLIAIFSIAISAYSSSAAASFNDVKSSFKPSDTLILDRQGELLHRLRTDSSVRRGQWVALADVSPALRTALVLSEDKRFYEHSGVDWQAVSAAVWANLWNHKTRGASTLTMQLAGLLDDDLKRSSGGRSVFQKVGQTVSAQMLEQSWRKDQILEAYLNLVPFRGELVGIDALSQTLFGKAAHGLDEREAAVAVALVRAPNAKPAQVAQRACAVLQSLPSSPSHLQASPKVGLMGTSTAGSTPASKTMAVAPATDCDALDLLTTAALQRRDFDSSEGIAPHVARHVAPAQAEPAPTHNVKNGSALLARTATAPASITTTLSVPLQRFAVQTLQQHLRELRDRHVEDGALVVLDNASGDVLAWIGSSGELSQAKEVDGVMALRQPGSTLKPFLYAQAIAQRRITAASLLEDSGTQIQTTGGLYIPQNYDHQFKGWVSVRTALAASLNVPAVRTLVMVSPDAFHKQLVKLGLPLKESGDYYGYSLALGSAEVSLLALTNAYRALANGGRFGPSRLTLSPSAARQNSPSTRPVVAYAGTKPPTMTAANEPKQRVLDPRAAFIVGDILSDPNARARTFGTDSVLATRFWTAVKTGTSKDMRDNWAVGYSQRYTVGVWVGNVSGAPMWDVSGTTGAAPIWAAVMNRLHASQPSRAPTPPAGVVQTQVQFGNITAQGANGAGTGSSAGSSAGQGAARGMGIGAAGSAGTAPIEATRNEWFMAGTQQASFTINSIATSAYETSTTGQKDLKISRQAANQPTARITNPTTGTIIALDPDIPPNRQRVSFTAEGNNLRWLLDRKPLTKGNSAQWLPWPGRHVLQIVDTRGTVLDEVKLEVRGAGVVGKR